MARKRDRAFALTLAVVFFFTAFGFSFYVIWQSTHQNSDSSTVSQTSQTAAQQCVESSPAEAAITAPQAYIPTGTISQLQTTDLVVGNGAKAADGDCLTVKYYGTLASNGTVFDENFDKSTGFSFQLGAGQVIKGWDNGLVGMRVGGTRRLVIPATLGYGANSPSSAIPANSNLVFVVKLLNTH